MKISSKILTIINKFQQNETKLSQIPNLKKDSIKNLTDSNRRYKHDFFDKIQEISKDERDNNILRLNIYTYVQNINNKKKMGKTYIENLFTVIDNFSVASKEKINEYCEIILKKKRITENIDFEHLMFYLLKSLIFHGQIHGDLSKQTEIRNEFNRIINTGTQYNAYDFGSFYRMIKHNLPDNLENREKMVEAINYLNSTNDI